MSATMCDTTATDMQVDDSTSPNINTAIKSLDDSEEKEPQVLLVSQEGDKFEMITKIAIQAELIKTMHEGDPDEREIHLPNVKSAVLNKIMDYMKHHYNNPGKEIEKPISSADMSTMVSEWDVNFTNVDQEMLFELITAANYIDYKPLLDIMCAKVASLIRGKLNCIVLP